eukprot:TRINITY_DN6420_c0_g2_i1.p1 TRINITY_DN6420_c0_g2~~TRINITY_DN6420_c0_g2_i1.p1  ORF type:complete len:646 (-),score=106.83 TRINITY_DN6420_c0_g2_i1:68-2005(-)
MQRYLVPTSAVAVVFVGYYMKPERIIPATTSELPERLQVFLETHNLTSEVDKNLAAWEGLQPASQPGAPSAKKHPVVFIPGITSCALEVWKPLPCFGDSWFRKRIWTDFSMAEAILKNWTCWLDHIKLDPVTGDDLEGRRVRSGRGLHSADYFIGHFHLWAKMIENLAVLGYNEEDMLLECYDWRLAFPILEKRDRYFTQMKLNIERSIFINDGHKAVILGHSMGGNVGLYFLKWVDATYPGWVDKHVHAFVNIGGAILGALDPLAAFVSGEMQSTAAMGPMGSYLEALALTWDQARDIYWSLGGLGSLLPMGGNAVWGGKDVGFTDSPVEILDWPGGDDAASVQHRKTIEDLYTAIENRTDLPFATYAAWREYERAPRRPAEGDATDVRRLSNPLASALPFAPNMKIYCFYGSGLPTPRSFMYTFRQVRWSFADYNLLPEYKPTWWSVQKELKETIGDLEAYRGTPDFERPVKIDAGGVSLHKNVQSAIDDLKEQLESPTDKNPERWLRIASRYHSPKDDKGPWGNGQDGVYQYGASFTDGDGTVPLVSLGYMCSNGWRDFETLNPAGIKVHTKEYMHDPAHILVDARGGPTSAKHVEIIGNYELIGDVLHIVAGNATHLNTDKFISNISAFGPLITERLRKVL